MSEVSEIREVLRRRLQHRIDLVVLLSTGIAIVVQLIRPSGAQVNIVASAGAFFVVALFGIAAKASWTPAAYVVGFLITNPIYMATSGPLVGIGAACVSSTALAIVFLGASWRWAVITLLAITPVAVGGLFELGLLGPAPVFRFDDAHGWQRTATAAAVAMTVTALIVSSVVRGLHRARLELEVSSRRERAARAEAERLERELARSRRAELIVELAAEVGADLGAALATVADRAALLTHEVEDEESRACLSDVIAAAANAGDTMRSLTVFNADATGDDARCDAALTARSLPQIFRRTIPDAIALGVSAVDDLWVGLSTTDLMRILGNLVLNARDAITGSGAISVVVERDDEHVVIRVRDDGAGMDAVTAAQIFQPFFTTKPVGRGTGLGLATTRVLLERAHGEISVTSAPGEGACFTIRLPRVAPLGSSS